MAPGHQQQHVSLRQCDASLHRQPSRVTGHISAPFWDLPSIPSTARPFRGSCIYLFVERHLHAAASPARTQTPTEQPARMSWMRRYDVAVAAARSDSPALFQVTLVPRDGSNQRIMIDQTLAAFHTLRATLLQVTREAPATRTPQWMQRVISKAATSTACICESRSTCPFQSLHTVVRSLGSLPTLSSRLFRANQSKTGNDTLLERWLQRLHVAITAYSDVVLQTKYQRGDCQVLNAYTTFLNAATHFPVTSATSLRQPLALRAWRAERDVVKEDESVILCDDEEDPASSNGEEIHRLPRLDVKRVGLATMQSFLEDFCETILTQYGQDIKELQSPELTMARRWEIALYVACRIGHSYGVQLIMFYYADANVTMADGTSCLHIASRMGRPEIVQILLNEGADVNSANNSGITPLIAACRNGCGEVVKLLLAAGASLSAASVKGTQAIHAAIVSQNVELVHLLLKRGANVRATTASGLTPLHFAARLGSVEITELLLKHRADPEQQTKSGSDAIAIATTNGHLELCELFQKEMDRKHVLSSSGGKLFHRFKKTASHAALNVRATIPAVRDGDALAADAS